MPALPATLCSLPLSLEITRTPWQESGGSHLFLLPVSAVHGPHLCLALPTAWGANGTQSRETVLLPLITGPTCWLPEGGQNVHTRPHATVPEFPATSPSSVTGTQAQHQPFLSGALW